MPLCSKSCPPRKVSIQFNDKQESIPGNTFADAETDRTTGGCGGVGPPLP
jgi:hypothetical protein